MPSTAKTPFRLGLASMPWAIFNRPSIQMAALKAYMDRESECETDIFHPYLGLAAEIGTAQYHYLAKNSWAGEALYAPLLFPEMKKQAEKLFYRECRHNSILKKLDYDACARSVHDNVMAWIGSLDLSRYRLFGFSICFNQLLSSLGAARLMKEARPDLPIVMGGSGCIGKIGSSLLKNFNQIDYIINGEGEEGLNQLCRHLESDNTISLAENNVLNRTQLHSSRCAQGIKDLNSLPVPDYSQYFKEMRNIFPETPFVPSLPIEFSRGCWWNKCKFCNLNLQWRGYRKKSAETVLREVRSQADRYQCLDFCFTDNALPPKETDIFFDALVKDNINYDFFAELRVITTTDTMKKYRQGGLSTIQVGIEALSTRLLKKMDKGTSCIENIAAMRQSAEAGIKLEGNLICEFPGSTELEVEETIRNMDFVLPYQPLSGASFFLGHGSPVAEHPGEYDITAIMDHHKNRMLFPHDLLKNLNMLIKGYRGDRIRQKSLWRPVHTKIAKWHKFHESRNSQEQALSYREGNSFIIIRQEQLSGAPLRHRLQGASREIYLFCRDIRTIDEIQQSFPGIKKKAIEHFLKDLENRRILFIEENRCIALAVQVRP